MAFTLRQALLAVAATASCALAAVVPPNVDQDFWDAVRAASATYDPSLGVSEFRTGDETNISSSDHLNITDGPVIGNSKRGFVTLIWGACFSWPGGSPGDKLNPYLNDFLNCVQDLKSKDTGEWIVLGPKGEFHYNYGTAAIVVRNQDECESHEFHLEALWNQVMSQVWKVCSYNAQGWAYQPTRSDDKGPIVYTIRQNYTPLPKATYEC